MVTMGMIINVSDLFLVYTVIIQKQVKIARYSKTKIFLHCVGNKTRRYTVQPRNLDHAPMGPLPWLQTTLNCKLITVKPVL